MAAENMVDIFSGTQKGQKVTRKKHTVLWIVLSAAVVLGGLGGLFGKQIYQEYLRQQKISSVIDTDTFYPGITVQGIDLGGKTMDEAEAEIKKIEPGLRGKYDIKVKCGSKSWSITEEQLNFTFDTESVLKEAYAYARSGDREERYKQVTALGTTPKNYEITSSMNYDGIGAKLKEIAKGVACDPVEPTVASFNAATGTFQFTDGKNGLAVDEKKLYNQVTAVLNNAKTGTVEVPTQAVPFSKTVAEVKSHLQKLGTYSTVSTNNANGTYNMNRALARVNGTCIPAGGTFSFHKVVGNSNKENGYLEAGAILNGKFIKAYGGGICQASTTVYGAALRSNMTIVERSNHTIQSTYCPIGQDAAVSYPGLDLKFKNSTEYPIYIVTGSKGKVLTATFYGYQSPDYDVIQITSVKTASIPAPTTPKYTVDKTLAKGVIKLDSKARDGSRATAQRVFYKNGAVVKTEALPASYYHALPAFYSIGPGTAVSGGTTVSSQASSSVSSKPSSSAAAKPSSKPNSSSVPSSSKPVSSAAPASSAVPQSDPESPESSSSQGEDDMANVTMPE